MVINCNVTPNNTMNAYFSDDAHMEQVYITEKVGNKSGWQSVCADEDLARGYSAEIQDFMSHMLGETLNAVYLSKPVVGDTVLIIGAGAVGISLLALLKCTFADKVIVADIMEEKLAFAKSVGADAVLRSDDPDFQEKIRELTGGRGVNKIFEAVGRQETYSLAFDTIAYNGLIIAFGMMEGEMIVPFRKMINSECSVQWCRNTGKGANQNKARILDMIARGALDVRPFITSRFALADINEAFAQIAKGREIRTLIEIDNEAWKEA